MAELVLGPLLRYVDETTAAVWVETSAPCTVRILHASAPTFTVHGHHYALVEIEGLEAGSAVAYTVELDGVPVWPEPGSAFPPSRIPTTDPSRRFRILLGSCRTIAPHDPARDRGRGADALRSYAYRVAGEAQEERPALLLLLGDQVYADSPPAEVRDFIRARRDAGEEPGEEIADFEEYAELYRLAWSDPAVRWLMSTIPTAMIFDDHDLRDDWNTSAAWRREMELLPWWQRRVVAGLGSYWLYQHLGNMSPAERAADPLFRALRDAPGDGAGLLDAFAWSADENKTRHRWSFARDHGGTRLVVLDSRGARELEPGRRDMLHDSAWAWFDELATGDVDHLVIGSSVPVLLPTALHYAENWNEAVADGAWGRRMAGLGERLRRAIDLEHWGAFRRSFARLARVTREVASGRRGRPPATITFLSGDVHYSYLARVSTAETAGARGAAGAGAEGGGGGGAEGGGEGGVAETVVSQVVCSPIRNPLSPLLRTANVVAAFAGAGPFGRLLARTAGLPRAPLRWRLRRGPWFSNSVATLDLDGRSAQVRWWTPRAANGDPPAPALLAEADLTPRHR